MLDNGDANIFFFSRRGGQTETVFKSMVPVLNPVLQIRISMDPELLLGSGSTIIVPDPAKNERADE